CSAGKNPVCFTNSDCSPSSGTCTVRDFAEVPAPTNSTKLAANACATMTSEPHYTTDGNTPGVVSAVRAFVNNGGNTLGQCEGAHSYENDSVSGHFQTTL